MTATRISNRRKLDLADRISDAVENLTADRQSRTYAAQWVAVHGVAKHPRTYQ